MKIAFLASDKPREQLLADAFLMGARRHGHQTEVIPLTGEAFVGGYDVACMVGVKSRALFQAHGRAGVPTIYLDKGYARHSRSDGVSGWEYWRVAINDHQPTDRLGRDFPHDRLTRIGWEPAPWRKAGKTILLAGSSAKYHEFYGLREPTSWMHHLVQRLRLVTERPLVYRPKPSWREAVPIAKTNFSRPPQTLAELLPKAHLLITHGSNSCFDAVLAGVPSIVLGQGVARPISSTDILDIENPRMVSDKARKQWLANLAYWQWTQPEMVSGDAWAFIGEQIHG